MIWLVALLSKLWLNRSNVFKLTTGEFQMQRPNRKIPSREECRGLPNRPESPDDPRLYWLPLEAAAEPLEGLITCYKNKWWVYVEGRGILFWLPEPHKRDAHLYPQCNDSKSITECCLTALYVWPPELGQVEVRQVPLVYQRAWHD